MTIDNWRKKKKVIVISCRCEQLYQEAKIAGKKAKERTKFHQENTISIAENVRKLNEQKSQLSYLVKVLFFHFHLPTSVPFPFNVIVYSFLFLFV